VFEDKRSKQVLLAAHCVLNQNAKIDRCAHYPGMVHEVVNLFFEAGVGVIQMPCPELLYLGLDRQVDHAAVTTIKTEDTRVARRMVEARSQALCGEIASNLVYQVEEYQKNGFEVVGVVGINGSPTCGVETTWSNDREEPGLGVLMQALQTACHRQHIALSLRGIKAVEPQQATIAVRELLSAALGGV
jgi:predicted secreted protein